MIKVKFSYPSWWDIDWGGGMFLWETPGRKGNFNNIHYYINQEVEECDYWFVYDDIDQYLFEKTVCPPENVFFITGEVKPIWQYDQKFLNQFAGVITARTDIKHRQIFREQHICTWHVKKDLDFLRRNDVPKKNRNLSAIISSASRELGHKERFEFIKFVKQNLSSHFDWYGKGINMIDDKWEGLSDYRYSIAIENSTYPNYFTEKILDCYLSYTMPIYYGCPNILNFFPKESMTLIDIYDHKKSLEIINSIFASDVYNKNLDAIIYARDIVLNKVGFFPYLNNWIQRHQLDQKKKKKVYLQQKKVYDNQNQYTLKRKLYKAYSEVKLISKGYEKPVFGYL